MDRLLLTYIGKSLFLHIFNKSEILDFTYCVYIETEFILKE